MGQSELFRFKQSYKKGDVLGRRGETADVFYILVEGEVRIHVGEKLIAMIERPGEYFGEMAALLNQKRTATMTCDTDATVYALPIRCLDRAIAANPDVAVKLLHTLAERLNEMLEERIAPVPAATSHASAVS